MTSLRSSPGVRAPLIAALLCAWSLLISARPAQAFDYLEHMYFTDTACRRVQLALGERLKREPLNEALASRYVALGLMCPERWERPYCAGGYKQLEASVNRLEREPKRSHDYAITLGDYAALPDHVSRFGPVRGMTRAGEDGLLLRTMEWMARPLGSAGGVIEDVAEDACEVGDLAGWREVEADVDAYLLRAQQDPQPARMPRNVLSPIARAPSIKGPSDPAGAYSFDNPHYLDLVFRNHHHFGDVAYGAWVGFHSAGVEIAARTCPQTIDLDARELRRVAALLDAGPARAGYKKLDWEGMHVVRRRQVGCWLLGAVVAQRAREWMRRADPALVAPARLWLDGWLGSPGGPVAVSARGQADALVGAVSSLVFEASGLHFLQDGLSAGHMRTIRTRGGLQEARYDHDRDNAEGVVGVLRTRAGSYPMVAYGDSHMMGKPYGPLRRCDWEALGKLGTLTNPRLVTDCIVQNQRGVLLAATMASLYDWALGGTLYGWHAPTPTTISPRACASLDPLRQFICAHLPRMATLVGGQPGDDGTIPTGMTHGALPVPPPPFSYQSLTVRAGFDVEGRGAQLQLNVSLFDELDTRANWMTSYRLALATTLGEGPAEQWFGDLSYGFHWRWAARFTLDASVGAFAGFRDFSRNTSFFMGVSPSAGLTVLPEGWMKIPLEVSLAYRFPLTFFSSDQGFFSDVIEGHWLYVGFGLAFMS